MDGGIKPPVKLRDAIEDADKMLDGDCQGVVITIKDDEYMLCLPVIGGSLIDYVAMAHECNHLTFFMLADRGVEIYDRQRS